MPLLSDVNVIFFNSIVVLQKCNFCIVPLLLSLSDILCWWVRLASQSEHETYCLESFRTGWWSEKSSPLSKMGLWSSPNESSGSITGSDFPWLSQIESFWQFLIRGVRIIGLCLLGYFMSHSYQTQHTSWAVALISNATIKTFLAMLPLGKKDFKTSQKRMYRTGYMKEGRRIKYNNDKMWEKKKKKKKKRKKKKKKKKKKKTVK